MPYSRPEYQAGTLLFHRKAGYLTLVDMEVSEPVSCLVKKTKSYRIS